MAGIKKFGTFAGVYTPSVLTILGVIMYMRLGWVVGQAGLIGAIIIILVAHIISISTGLSISSIATDKKIKTGGIYYILSRSLGLPMGGAIGITLFIGTALSIALYLIGFAENFLSIEVISNFLGLEQGVNSYRIIGTFVLIFLVIIAFISTSLAIKTQFFVLGAIGLSLVSIVLGMVFIDTSDMPQLVLHAAENHVPIITIFAIFFPAVTGFTAGVAMSGDLQDPKSSIPKGTMWAIATGLVVYILLAILVAYFVDRNILINDTNFLQQIAIYSPLVVAGIWGATLSSALGGILGAPRIVQAISNDKIGPSFLGKGYGEANEPRNALIFTFLIAEVGVLIGELDAIAEVVSMFYIAAYGFINLAFALESWASTDFRPSFKVNKWMGIIGFLASFGVMMQLNPGAMFAAFVVMWVIYFILKRKELKSDFGDVWGSVWSSIIRTSITKVSERSLEKRNWKPNILLFSGDTKDRPYLLELSKHFVGKYGFLSSFYLKITDSKQFAFTKDEQLISSEDNANGIFLRRHSVQNLYDGIEQISSIYGFAGVEPNTVFLGWARNTKEPVRFGQMLRNLFRLDFNVVLMDYDKRVGFGDKKQIDVWWRGQGQNGNLSLQLVKFLRESDDWEKAKLRILIVNPLNDEYENLHRQASGILHNLRIEGEVRVINNQIEKRSFYDIIQVESINSSIVFIGLPDINAGDELNFVKKTNILCENIGTVVLVRSSSNFLDLHIGNENNTIRKKSVFSKLKKEVLNGVYDGVDSINNYPKYAALAEANKKVLSNIQNYQIENNEKYLLGIVASENNAVNTFDRIIKTNTKSLRLVIEHSKADLLKAKLFSLNTKAFKEIANELNVLSTDYIDKQKEQLEIFLELEKKKILSLYNSLPSRVDIFYDVEDLKKNKDDNLDTNWYKYVNRLIAKFGKTKFKYRIKYKHFLIEHLLDEHLKTLDSFMTQFGLNSSQNIVAVENFISDLDKNFQKLSLINSQGANEEEMFAVINEIELQVEHLAKDINKRAIDLLKYRDTSLIMLIEHLNSITNKVAINSLIDEECNCNKILNRINEHSEAVPLNRHRNQRILVNHVKLNVKLLFFSAQLRQLTTLVEKRIMSHLQQDIIQNFKSYIKYLKSYQTRYKKSSNSKFNYDAEKLSIAFDNSAADNLMNLLSKTQKSLMKELPKTVEIFDEESDNLIGTEKQYENLTTVNLSVVRLMDYILQDEFSSSMQNIVSNMVELILSVNIELQDHRRLLVYNIENKSVEVDEFQDYLKKEIESLESKYTKYEESANSVLLQIEERQRIIIEKVSIYPFVQAAMNLRQYIKSRDTEKRNLWISRTYENANVWLRNLAADLWYRQSTGMIFTQDILQENDNSFSLNKKKRIVVSELNSPNNVLQDLPFYYKQLFVSRNNYMPEFWVERKSAEKEIERFISDCNIGVSQALLISGAPGTGKTFLSYRISHYTNSDDKIYTVLPPQNGSTNLKVFYRSLKEALDVDSVVYVFSGIKDKSIIIFEDVELWWNKSNKGFAIIDEIHSLIHKYADKFVFVVNINSFAFDFINKLRPLSDIYTHSVFLTSVDARMLENMIWKRHLLGGMKLSLGHKNQSNFHSWDFSILFSKYFRQSKGNAAAAMDAWVNNIIEIKDKDLVIRNPITVDIAIFELFTDLDLLVLQLFVLHKHLSYSKLAKLTEIDSEIIVRKINELKRVGIIKEISENVYSINSLIMPYIINVLKRKKYL